MTQANENGAAGKAQTLDVVEHQGVTKQDIASVIQQTVAAMANGHKKNQVQIFQSQVDNVPDTVLRSLSFQAREGRKQRNIAAVRHTLVEKEEAINQFTRTVNAKEAAVRAVIFSGLCNDTMLQQLKVSYPDLVREYEQRLEIRDGTHARNMAELRRDTVKYETEIRDLLERPDPSSMFRASLERQHEENRIGLELAMKHEVDTILEKRGIREQIDTDDFSEQEQQELHDTLEHTLAQQYVTSHGAE